MACKPSTAPKIGLEPKQLCVGRKQIGALEVGGVNEESQINVDCHAFEGPNAEVMNVAALGVSEVQGEQSDGFLGYPPGFEPHSSPDKVKRVETFILPEIEGIKAKKSVGRNGCSPKSHIEKRVTRSQLKQCKELLVRSNRDSKRRIPNKGGRIGSPQVSESVETTDSMRKLADDSLKMGELLGVKVIANRGNAVKRITQSLKSARSSHPVRKV